MSTGKVSIAFRRSPRSGPSISTEVGGDLTQSPLPFGVHRVPVEFEVCCVRDAARLVSIAFRRSPRSGLLSQFLLFRL